MEILKLDTFDAAIKLIDEGFNVVALDFASGTNPGGSRKNQLGTQEESLCRRSNLSIELKKKRYPMPTEDTAYYLSNIIISKDKNLIPLLKSYKCSVIASELKAVCERLDKYLESRIQNLYNIAINNNHNCIILGAWGCGAFSEADDDAEKMAKIIKKVSLKNLNIKTVCAVLGKNYNKFVSQNN